MSSSSKSAASSGDDAVGSRSSSLLSGSINAKGLTCEFVALWEPRWSNEREAALEASRFWDAWESYVADMSEEESVMFLYAAANMERSTGQPGSIVTIERHRCMLSEQDGDLPRRRAFESACGYRLRWRMLVKERAHGKFAFASGFEKVPEHEPATQRMFPLLLNICEVRCDPEDPETGLSQHVSAWSVSQRAREASSGTRY